MKKILTSLMIIATIFLGGCQANSSDSDIVVGEVSDNAKTTIKYTINMNVLTKKKNNDKLNDSYKKYVPESGYLVKDLQVELKSEKNIIEVLDAISKKEGFTVNYSEMGTSKYVSAINNIEAGLVGGYSGWLCKVNGEFPTTGLEEVVLKDGDIVTFMYTADGGKDVEKGE
ncbi:hypothetical protein OKW22_001334 [Bacilli bacterium PM5-3]|nr:hypothetical protein [Bacilli bacterium PM5-3]